MYSVKISWRVIVNWKAFNDWPGTGQFQTYLQENYAGIVSVGNWIPPTNRVFVFESEEHYQWFLLNQ